MGYMGKGKDSMNVGAVLQGEHGQRIAVAVVKVAQKVENNVRRIVAGAATPSTRDSSTPLGALQIKQVRRAQGKLHSVSSVPPSISTSQSPQPHLEVLVSPLGGGAAPSKWEDSSAVPKGSSVTKGSMMVDTGAGITLVTKAWVEAHGLKMSSPSAGKVRGASG